VKIAYLILAHNNPAHLRRLIRALREPWTEFYVHIDRKAPDTLFEAIRDEPQTEAIAARVDSCWGGYSLVQATLNLMAAALRAREPADRYVLISGADYPIRSNAEIRRFFEGSDAEYIGLMSMPTPDGRKPLARLETFHFEKARGGFKPQRVLLTQTNKLLVRFYKRDYRKALGDLQPYAGSQWWALTRDAAAYILDFVAANPRLIRFYRHALIPDEMFFQTVLGNSPFRDKTRRHLTYADWSEGLKRNPLPLTDAHIDRFTSPDFAADDVEGKGPCFFARKFSDNDGEFLDRIDAWRAQTSSADERTVTATNR
jgi:hypothetical protein